MFAEEPVKGAVRVVSYREDAGVQVAGVERAASAQGAIMPSVAAGFKVCEETTYHHGKQMVWS
jgi:hypothetical protein